MEAENLLVFVESIGIGSDVLDVKMRFRDFSVMAMILSMIGCGQNPRIDPHKASILDRMWMLSSLEALEPLEVESILNVHFTSEEVQDAFARDCENRDFDQARRIVYYSVQNSWYGPHLRGRQNLRVGAFMVNPAVTLEEPKIVYQTRISEPCPGHAKILKYNYAQFMFDNLPGYACIEQMDILRAFPNAKPVNATEGIEILHVDSPEMRRTGIRQEYFFRPGIGCALHASVTQSLRNTR
jgi:hypothetical protein